MNSPSFEFFRAIRIFLLLVVTLCAFCCASADSWKATLAVGDRVAISVKGHPELDAVSDVTAAGFLRLTVGSFFVRSLPIEALQQRLESNFRNLLGARARVEVEVIGRGTNAITVEGAVTFPGQQIWVAGATIEQILEVAGLANDADPQRVEISGVFGTSIIDATLRTKSVCQPGDVITVNRRTTSTDVLIVGGVVKPGTFVFKQGMTLGDLVLLAGGLNGVGDSSKVFVMRAGKQNGPYDLEKHQELQLQRGDQVRVEVLTGVRFVSFSELGRPSSSLPIKPGMTLLQFLTIQKVTEKPGGVLVTVQGLSTAKKPMKKFPLEDLMSGKITDPLLEADDIIIVSRRG